MYWTGRSQADIATLETIIESISGIVEHSISMPTTECAGTIFIPAGTLGLYLWLN